MRVRVSGNTDFHAHVAEQLSKAGIGIGNHLYHYEIRLTEADNNGIIIIACNGRNPLLVSLLRNFHEVMENFGRVEVTFTPSDKEIELLVMKGNERQMECVEKALIHSLQQTSVRRKWF